MRVLVTRPEADALRTAKRLKALGYEAVIDPLLKIEAMEFEPVTGRYDGVIITSTNAIRAAGEKTIAALRSLPLYAVGMQSGEAAFEAGFRDIKTGGDAFALAALLRKSLTAGARLLYLAGAARAQDLAALVKDAGIEIELRVVYRAVPATKFSEDTIAYLRGEGIGAVLHYSRRSAKNFITLLEKEKLLPEASTLRHLCISDTAAAPLHSAGFRVEVAHEPSEDALFALLD